MKIQSASAALRTLPNGAYTDNMGRELDISIEAGEVIKCRIPEFDAKDVGLGLIQLHANSAKELP
ncbi:MAG: hypothetical protein JNM34_12845 [Chthonomonadaceae bacterium]|nr:hypothetical protein [Chthonomonadaceae bacterium]